MTPEERAALECTANFAGKCAEDPHLYENELFERIETELRAILAGNPLPALWWKA